MSKLKDKVYDFLVHRNGRIWYEYERYVNENIAEHKRNRFKHVWVLIKLNWFYRVKKNNTPYLYKDVPMDPNAIKTLEITKQPESTVGLPGQTVSFNVAASGEGLKYQWQFKNPGVSTWVTAGIPSAKTATIQFTVGKERSLNGRSYRCIIKDKYGKSVTTDIVKLTGKTSAFAIVKQPESVSAVEGDEVRFTVIASGEGLKYQWQFKNVGDAGWTSSGVSAAKTDTMKFVVGADKTLNGREYRCVLKDRTGRTITTNVVKLSALIKSLYNPESSKINKNAPHWLAMELLPYEVISFDIFDTLIFRPFDNPKTLFNFVGERLGISGFINLRVNAEKEARDKHFIECGNRETNLREIYEVINRKTGLDVEKGMQVECECEVEFCYANPYMKELYDILQCQKKNIIIVSDMYLPSKVIGQMLEKCGFTNYKKLYVSNECQLCKSNGSLFTLVLNDLEIEAGKMIHIGDNDNGDIKMATANGIVARKYHNTQTVGNPYRAMNMSSLIGSSYRGIVNNKFFNGKNNFSHGYEYGYSVGGLYVWGYMNHLRDYVERNGVDCILFVARDGFIYKKIFDKYIDCDVTTKYFLWSRIASEFCNIEDTRESFINTYVNGKVNAKYPVMMEDLFESLGIGSLLPLLEEYNIPQKANICAENRGSLARFFASEWDKVVECTQKFTEELRNYVIENIEGKQNIAIVDVGWTGSNVAKLRSVIHKIDPTKKVTVFLAGYTSTANSFEELTGNIVPYLFSHSMNKDKHYAHHKDKKPVNNLFEIMTQALMPTFYGIKDNDYYFDIPEVENYEIIYDIHKGIEDFVVDWTGFFEKSPYMNNISGSDAYCPFEKKIQDFMWFKIAFGDFCVSLKTLSNSKKQKLETIKEII